MHTFKLDAEEQKLFDEWKVKQIKKSPGTATVGGRWTFHFTPTSIGIVVEATDNATGDIIDLTCHNNW